MCIHWGIIRDCGCENVSLTKCLIGVCPGVEMIQSQKKGMCDTCTQRQPDLNPGRLICSAVEEASGQIHGHSVKLVHPWQPSLFRNQDQGSWTSPTRRKADDAWEREHYTRMLDYHCAENETNGINFGEQVDSTSILAKLSISLDRTDSRDSGYSSLCSKQSSSRQSRREEEIRSKSRRCPCSGPFKPKERHPYNPTTGSSGTKNAVQSINEPFKSHMLHLEDHVQNMSSAVSDTRYVNVQAQDVSVQPIVFLDTPIIREQILKQFFHSDHDSSISRGEDMGGALQCGANDNAAYHEGKENEQNPQPSNGGFDVAGAYQAPDQLGLSLVDSMNDLEDFDQNLTIKGLHGVTSARKIRGDTSAGRSDAGGCLDAPADYQIERITAIDATVPEVNAETAGHLTKKVSSTPAAYYKLNQPDLALSRGFDSSGSLLTLSEGELSFLGLNKVMTSGDIAVPTLFNHAAEAFWRELSSQLLKRVHEHSAGHRQAPAQDSDRTSSRASSSSSRVGSRTTAATSAIPARNADSGRHSPDDEESGRLPRLKRKLDDREPETRLFACPFAKFDPAKYSRENLTEPEYWSCSTCCLRNISRLKQHLYRVHSRPPYYCDRCFRSFKVREELAQHVRQEPPCELERGLPRYADRMTDTQFEAIKRRIMRGDPPEIWYTIFAILFPDAPKPMSPYMTTADATTVNHFVSLFRWFGPEVMMQMIRQRQNVETTPLEVPTQVVVDEAFEIAMSEYLRGTQASQPPPAMIDDQLGDIVEVPDEDVLLMAPVVSRQRNEGASDQSQHQHDSFNHQTTVGTEQSTHIMPHLAAEGVEDSVSHSYSSQVQGAFNQYTEFYSGPSFPHLDPWVLEDTTTGPVSYLGKNGY